VTNPRIMSRDNDIDDEDDNKKDNSKCVACRRTYDAVAGLSEFRCRWSQDLEQSRPLCV